MATTNAPVAVSAPGKVLLAGGYLVLDRLYTGLVFGLSARINVVTQAASSEGHDGNEIVVDSPQFLQAQWRYSYTTASEGGGIKVTQSQSELSSPNPFVETTLNYVLSYISKVSGKEVSPTKASILADTDYYSQSGTSKSRQGSRFVDFGVSLKDANKTGLGSSAALVSSLTASLLSYYLPTEQFDLASAKGKRTLHNLAQAAHCAAQGKVGSGFDVAAAVFGSCTYRRFSPSVLSAIPEAGSPGFGEKLVSVVDREEWDVQVDGDDLTMPSGVTLRMCDVDCGSQTVGMVKKVLAWKAGDAEGSKKLWDELQSKNEELGACLQAGNVDSLPQKIGAVRELIREMGHKSDVPIEPDTQTELLDAVSAVDGVYGGVVPGAGGFDAAALLVKDDEETKKRVDEFLALWSAEKGSKVKLLAVKGETEGARKESLELYNGWL